VVVLELVVVSVVLGVVGVVVLVIIVVVVGVVVVGVVVVGVVVVAVVVVGVVVVGVVVVGVVVVGVVVVGVVVVGVVVVRGVVELIRIIGVVGLGASVSLEVIFLNGCEVYCPLLQNLGSQYPHSPWMKLPCPSRSVAHHGSVSSIVGQVKYWTPLYLKGNTQFAWTAGPPALVLHSSRREFPMGHSLEQ